MPAKDIYHNTVKNALVKDGWTITHDPLRLSVDDKNLFIDLGAEQIIAAEKGPEKIAVEIKSFIGRSEVDDLEDAVGQFVLYQDLLEEEEPDRVLFPAIREKAFERIFTHRIGTILLNKKRVRLMVFREADEVILRWIS
ncbi:MAG: XisH family protein [Acidobacteria bacterium]|nr:XisH family protein [Acidobacteriota bacterium]